VEWASASLLCPKAPGKRLQPSKAAKSAPIVVRFSKYVGVVQVQVADNKHAEPKQPLLILYQSISIFFRIMGLLIHTPHVHQGLFQFAAGHMMMLVDRRQELGINELR